MTKVNVEPIKHAAIAETLGMIAEFAQSAEARGKKQRLSSSLLSQSNINQGEAMGDTERKQMRKIILLTAIGAIALAFQHDLRAADAKRAMDEAQEHGCLKCHDVDKKKVGPSYKDISAKLKGKKVEEGMAAMKAKPVHKSVLGKTTDSSLKEILEWVMSL